LNSGIFRLENHTIYISLIKLLHPPLIILSWQLH
jgi:hypothetical protein